MNPLRRLLIAVGLVKLVTPARAQDLARSKALNDGVRADLLKSGDDGKTPRDVNHYFYKLDRGDAANPASVSDYLTKCGLSLSATEPEVGFVGNCTSEVASRAFDMQTAKFDTDMAGFGWSYDGWECAVVHPAA